MFLLLLSILLLLASLLLLTTPSSLLMLASLLASFCLLCCCCWLCQCSLCHWIVDCFCGVPAIAGIPAVDGVPIVTEVFCSWCFHLVSGFPGFPLVSQNIHIRLSDFAYRSDNFNATRLSEYRISDQLEYQYKVSISHIILSDMDFQNTIGCPPLEILDQILQDGILARRGLATHHVYSFTAAHHLTSHLLQVS